MILVSACLAGDNCKYSAGNNLVPEIRDLVLQHKAAAACPEQLGGLPTPRPCSEIINGRVINTEGQDVTEQFMKGAEKALAIYRENHCDKAVLKANSPSCGIHCIYDGTFSHTLIEGKGCFAKLLQENGIACMDEKEFLEELK